MSLAMDLRSDTTMLSPTTTEVLTHTLGKHIPSLNETRSLSTHSNIILVFISQISFITKPMNQLIGSSML